MLLGKVPLTIAANTGAEYAADNDGTAFVRRHCLLAPGVLFAILSAGCSVVPVAVPEMAHEDASGVAISVKIIRPLGWPTSYADQVYFVMLEGDADATAPGGTVLRSNFAKDGTVYLLNARPGEYAAVAAWSDRGGTPPPGPPLWQVKRGRFSMTLNQPDFGAAGYTTYFPESLVKLIRVTVGKGQLVCAGAYVLSTSALGDRDATQRHYQSLISRGISWRGTPEEARNDADTRKTCMEKAKQDLANSEWSAMLR